MRPRRPTDIQISMDDRWVDGLEDKLRRYQGETPKRVFKAFKSMAFMWHANAVKRIPVDTGNASQRLLHAAFMRGGNSIAQVGSNIVSAEGEAYPARLEFGSDRIAKGQVKALGKGLGITDLMAVHTWPAKEADETHLTSHSIVGSGARKGRLLNKKGRLLAKKPQEQMPYIRPAFNVLRKWFFQNLMKALLPKE